MSAEKHWSLWSIAAGNLRRYRPRTIAVLVPLVIVMGAATSVTLVRDGLSRDASLSVSVLPDITVQRMVGGRVERIELSHAESIGALEHVASAVARVWGYVPVTVPRGEVAYTLMGIDLERMPIAQGIGLTIEEGRFLVAGDTGKAVVGEAFASVFSARAGDRIDLEDTLGSAIELEIVGIFSASAEIYAADLIVVPIDTAREYFGYGDDEASDICVYLDDPVNTGLAAVRILELGDNLRIVTRDAMAGLNEQAFGRRGGVFQLMWMVLLLTVCLVAWAQAASIGLALKREIGILKAVGWSTLDIIELKLLESVILALLGTFGGMLLGLAYVALDAPGIKQFFLGWATIYPEFPLPVHMSLPSLFLLFVIGVFPLVVATVVPAWRVGTIEPDSAIRGGA
jgi:ABC-type lipoprotein release transport system permease subunit